MPLSFEQKVSIFEESEFQMQKYEIKPNKINFKYKGKVIVRELREGSTVGYLWGKEIQKVSNKYKIDDRGWIHIHNFSEQEIRELLIEVLSIQDKIHLLKRK